MGSVSAHALDFNNIQGDILVGLPKKTESCVLFRINTPFFQTQLLDLVPLITTTADTTSTRKRIGEHKRHYKEGLLELSGINLAFSQKGLTALGIDDDLDDEGFKKGMLNDATGDGGLGDDLDNWDERFKGDIHGVLLITANDEAGFTIVLQLDGKVRPGVEDGHEHFGFNDGLSQPAVTGVPTPSQPGQETIAQGVVLLGREGDKGDVPPGGSPAGVTRPAWAQDKSFLAFRYLQQLVPKFNEFLERNALPVPPIIAPGDPTGAELLGARLVGQWKSGAPIFNAPLRDDPALAAPELNQDFRYDPSNQNACPFAAHTRKMNPRSDLDAFGGTEVRRIMRRGIAFGPEVTPEEVAAKKSSEDPQLLRGLLFVSYQSNLFNDFQFLRKSWANNVAFPPKSNVAKPGLNPIIGAGTDRAMVGSDPNMQTAELPLGDEVVVSKGGEYFMSSSISALKTVFAKAGAQQEL